MADRGIRRSLLLWASIVIVIVAALVVDVASIRPELKQYAEDSLAPRAAIWIREALIAQGEALVSGDERRYLGTIGPELRSAHQTRFASLRGMHVAQWTGTMLDGPVAIGPAQWRATIQLRYCFLTLDCARAELTLVSEWLEKPEGGVMLTALADNGPTKQRPLPWEVSDLRSAVDKQVYVITTAKYESQVFDLAKTVQRIAEGAEPFTIGPRPARWVVYAGDQADIETWFGGGKPELEGAHLVTLDGKPQIVALMRPLDGQFELLVGRRLAQVAMGPPTGDADDAWWLREGIADVVALTGLPVEKYPLASTREYVDSGDWDRKLTQRRSPDPAQSPARGGLAFLAVRCLTEAYGGEAVRKLYQAVDGGTGVVAASRTALGVSWNTAERRCVAQIDEWLES